MRNIKDNSQYNIVVLGDIRAGKTTLVSQYIFNTVRTSYKPTIEDCYRTLARLPGIYPLDYQLVFDLENELG